MTDTTIASLVGEIRSLEIELRDAPNCEPAENYTEDGDYIGTGTCEQSGRYGCQICIERATIKRELDAARCELNELLDRTEGSVYE